MCWTSIFVILTLIPATRRIPAKINIFRWIHVGFFLSTFRCFRWNESILETTETKHTDSKLHFGTRNIEFRLLVFENELVGDAMVFPRSIKSENTYFNYIFCQIFDVEVNYQRLWNTSIRKSANAKTHVSMVQTIPEVCATNVFEWKNIYWW